MLSSLILFLLCLAQLSTTPADLIDGAWDHQHGDGSHTTFIFVDGFWSSTRYDTAKKEFSGTRGGRYEIKGDQMMQLIEFDTYNSSLVGASEKMDWKLTNDELIFVKSNHVTPFRRLDNGTPGKLAGAWVITGRVSNGELRTMTAGARRTMKILSGTRFQWIAYNVETKEFSGTGGGTYTTVDGKYTENIEFFSRDNSRVGARLTFDFALENKTWRHKGLSSKGEPIDEVWSRRVDIGL